MCWDVVGIASPCRRSQAIAKAEEWVSDRTEATVWIEGLDRSRSCATPSGTWRHNYTDLHGTSVGTLLDDGKTLDFLMHEELSTGIETNHFRGQRAK